MGGGGGGGGVERERVCIKCESRNAEGEKMPTNPQSEREGERENA